jgi:hypothetical protein
MSIATVTGSAAEAQGSLLAPKMRSKSSAFVAGSAW